MAKKEEILSSTEKKDLIIQTGLQIIPYVGSSIATFYYGRKQEIRFKRLERFFDDLSKELKDIKDEFASPDDHDKEKLAVIIEELSEKVEKETSKQKIEYLKTFFKNNLIEPVKEDFDERRFFLDTLSTMSLLECSILADLYTQGERVKASDINRSGVSQYAILGALGRLRIYGFLISQRNTFTAGRDSMLDEIFRVSDFGKRFCKFCLL